MVIFVCPLRDLRMQMFFMLFQGIGPKSFAVLLAASGRCKQI